MKHLLILLITAILVTSLNVTAQTKRTLTKTLALKMPKTVDDDMPGTRGASITWHPTQKKYYAAFAGNTGYPLAVFSIAGKRLSSDTLTTMADVRGLWYNPKTKNICGNGYSETGWFSYKLNAKGIPIEVNIDHEGMNQPDEQSVGAFNAVKNEVIFFNKQSVVFYKNDATASDKTVTIHFGKTKQDKTEDTDTDTDETPEQYNNSTVVYTGIKGAELGLLNTYDKQIELYNIDDGYLTSVLKLPADIPTESSFNFAYTNNIYWLFDIENRLWQGYK